MYVRGKKINKTFSLNFSDENKAKKEFFSIKFQFGIEDSHIILELLDEEWIKGKKMKSK